MNRLVLALSVARLGDSIGNSILFIVIPLYVAKLPAPWVPFPEPVRVGILISLYGFANSFLQPLAGAASDRLGRRKPLILAGLLVTGVSTLAYLLVGRFTDLLLLRVLQGLGVAMTIPASLALMATAAGEASRGGSMGIYTTMRMLGFSAGPPVGGYLLLRHGFDAAFYAGAGFIFLGAFLVLIWVAEPPAVPRRRPSLPFRIVDRELLSAGIVGAGLATFVMAGNYSMMVTLEPQFLKRLHASTLGFGIAFSALTVTRLLIQVPLGILSDRIGRKPLIVAGLALTAPATALLGATGTTLQLTGLRVFQGLASAGIAAPALALAGDLSRPGEEGRQMSLVTMGFGLGIALGPLLAGVLGVISLELPFLVGGFVALAAAWFVFRHVQEKVLPGQGRTGSGR